MNRDAVVELVTLPDGQYQTINAEGLRSLSGRMSPSGDDVARGTVEHLLVIGGPRVVDLQTVRRIPMLVASRSDGMRSWMVDPDQNFTWFITDVLNGVTKSISPQSLDKRRMETPAPSRSGSRPSDFDARAVTYGVERYHLPQVFGPKWPAGRYAVTLASYDRLSNTVEFETKPLPKQSPQLTLHPSPSISAIPGPPPNSASGNSIYVSKGSGENAWVRVGVVISMPVAGTVAARADDPTVSHPVIPVSLVLVKLDSAHPVQINLAVPAAVENGNVATRFSLNLRDVVPQALSGEYQLYLCSGVKVLGPQAVTLP